MAQGERKLLLIFGIGCLCIIGTSILLFSLWSYRVPIFFLLVGLVALQVIVTLALKVVQTVADTTVKLHEQKLRQERLRPNDNGYYEIPLDGGKVPTFLSNNAQYREEQEPYSNGYTPTQSYKGRWH
jgi:membrane protein implicated in regulation of membrane protease activity